MDRVCKKGEVRAEYLGESLQVNEVELSDSGGVACVTYDYDAYYGCKDTDHGDAIEDEWPFDMVGSKLAFSLEIPEIERDDEI